MVEVTKGETVIVSVNDLHSAFLVWMEHHRQYEFPWGSLCQARRAYSRFLSNAPLPAIMDLHSTWELTPEQEHRMRLLLSPHAHTIIKMYYAKQSSVEVPE